MTTRARGASATRAIPDKIDLSGSVSALMEQAKAVEQTRIESEDLFPRWENLSRRWDELVREAVSAPQTEHQSWTYGHAGAYTSVSADSVPDVVLRLIGADVLDDERETLTKLGYTDEQQLALKRHQNVWQLLDNSWPEPVHPAVTPAEATCVPKCEEPLPENPLTVGDPAVIARLVVSLMESSDDWKTWPLLPDPMIFHPPESTAINEYERHEDVRPGPRVFVAEKLSE